MFQIQTHGFDQLAAKLKAMPDDVMIKAITPSLRKGSIIVRDEAREKAPVHIGPYPASRTKTMDKALISQAYEEGKQLLADMQKEGPLSRKQIRAVKRSIKASLRASGRQMWNAIRKPGTLRDSIIVRRSTSKDKNTIMQNIELTKYAYYGRWLEFGFTHFGKKKKTHVPAHPYFRPALYNNVEKVIDIFRTQLTKYVLKAGNA
jgi:HK97 gp10 family phage protein